MSRPPLRHKLSFPRPISHKEVEQNVEQGGKFVVFTYCISFLVITLKRYSPAHFISAGESTKEYANKYNKLSKLFGWWAIPYGIGQTLSCIKFNHQGGLDVTEDIILNLTEEAIEKEEIELTLIHTIFQKPEADDLKMFKQVWSEKLDRHAQVNELIVGYFLNVDIDEEPYYVVGIKTSGDFKQTMNLVEKAVRKLFFRQTHFEFVDLTESDEFIQKLKKQGLKMI